MRTDEKQKIQELYPPTSAHAIAVYPADTEAERGELSTVIDSWMNTLDKQKMERSLSWFANSALLSSMPYTRFRWNGSDLRVETPRNQNQNFTIPRIVANLLLDPFQGNISLLTDNRPKPRVEPNSDDPVDEDAASLAEVVLSTLWEDPLNVPDKLRQLASQICVSGTAGAEITSGSTDTPLLVSKQITDPILGEIEVTESEGDSGPEMKLQVWSAFELQPNPEATDDPDTLSWLCHSRFTDVGWVKEAFNRPNPEDGSGKYFRDAVESIAPNTGTSSPVYWAERVKDILDSADDAATGFSSSVNGPNGGAPGANMVLLRTIDVKPNKHFPRGRTLVMAGNQLIYAGQARGWHPRYRKRWTPTVIFRYLPMVGRFWGMPLITMLAGLQRKASAIDHLIHVNRMHMAIGSWLIPKGSQIPDGFIGGPGQNVVYKPSTTGHVPTRIQNAPLPADVYNERAQILADIEKISGTKDILSGTNPSNVRSGEQLDFLKRQALGSKQVIFLAWQRSMEQLAQNILIEAATSMVDPNDATARKIAAAARTHSGLELQAFTGSDLRDNVMVKIDIASELLTSPEALQQKASQWLQYAPAAAQQLAPAQLDRLARAMGLDELAQDQTAMVTKTRRIIGLLKQGQLEAAKLVFPEVDDASTAVTVLTNEILRPSFWSLDTPVQDAMWQLLSVYQGLAAERAAAQIQLQQQQVLLGKEMAAVNGGGQEAQ